MSQAKIIPTAPTYYKATHSIYGEGKIYCSYLELCNETINLATAFVEDSIEEIVKRIICEVSDQMIETAYEYKPTPEELKELDSGKSF